MTNSSNEVEEEGVGAAAGAGVGTGGTGAGCGVGATLVVEVVAHFEIIGAASYPSFPNSN